MELSRESLTFGACHCDHEARSGKQSFRVSLSYLKIVLINEISIFLSGVHSDK